MIYLLTEAAEIEHGLMCTYLYASWSLKRAVDEGVTPAQLEAMDHWRKQIRGVAMEEMVHLALVNNMLVSIGSPPHFRRHNFPVPPGYHPSSLVVRLAPFTRNTLAHFMFPERPEGTEMAQAAGFESTLVYERRSPTATLTPTAEDYDTVGHLYRGIEQGFDELSASMGEAQLFSNPEAQLGRDVMDLEGLLSVTDLASARKAIEVIIEQGEGGRESRRLDPAAFALRPLFGHERTVRCLLARRPRVCPVLPGCRQPCHARPDRRLRHHPRARAARGARARPGLRRLWLDAAPVGQRHRHERGSAERRRVDIDAAVALMHLINSLAVALTTLPVDAGATCAPA